jgi:P-type Mg2+ transporter
MKDRKGIELFWDVPLDKLYVCLDTTPTGLTTAEAERGMRICGPNLLKRSRRTDTVTLLAAQFKSPLIPILIVAVGLSFFFNESINLSIIIAIILLSSLLGFWQEKRAADAATEVPMHHSALMAG